MWSNRDPVEVLASALGVAPHLIECIGRVDRGYGNRSYRLRYADDEYVVRFGAAPEHLPGVDRQAEHAALVAAAARSLAPEPIVCDPASGLLITRYLAGRTWTAADFTDRHQLVRLGRTFAALHAIPPPAGMRRLDLAVHVAALEARTTPVSARLGAAAGTLIARLGGSAPVLCHNDVHAGNVIDDGCLRLIDWEYAAIGDPRFDLAGPISYHRLGSDACEALLEGYGGDTRVIEPERLGCAIWLFEYVACLWELALPERFEAAAEPPVAVMQQPVRQRLRQLERLLDEPTKPLI